MKQLIVIVLSFLINITLQAQNVNQEWFKKLPDNSIGKLHIVTDSEGFIYAAGTFDNDSNGTDWRIYKLSPNSDTVFKITINGESNLDDYLNSIAVDNNDNVYLTGSIGANDDKTSVAVYKILSNGVIDWSVISEASIGLNEGSFILVDRSFNVYVTGNSDSLGNLDIFLEKYNSEGELVWIYSIDSSDDEVIKGLDACPNGNLVLAYDIFQSGTWDIGLRCVNAEGVLAYQTYFNGKDREDDRCNDLAIDNTNCVYIGGYSINDGKRDYLTIRYESTGSVAWYALFDEDGEDDEIASIKTVGNYVVVTGTSVTEEDTSFNSKIITILYSNSGTQQWKQTFKGILNGDDFGVKVIMNHDNEILVAGKVWTEQADFDLFIVNYTLDGNINWVINYNDTLNYPNEPSDITLDFLGNIYCVLNSVNGDTITAEVIKFNQPGKFIPVIKNLLKMLTVGLIEVSSDSLIKSFVYHSCQAVVDSSWHISYAALLDSCEGTEIDLKEVMNDKISDYFELPQRDYVDYIFKRLWVMGYKQMPFVGVPHYHHFDAEDLIDDPKLAFAYEEKSYPIPCVNCSHDSISKVETESKVAWVTLLRLPPWFYINGNPQVYLTSCWPYPGSVTCKVCSTHVAAGQIVAGSSSGQHHELEIILGSTTAHSPNNDNCYNAINYSAPSYYATPGSGDPGYARLTAIQYLPFYRRVDDNPAIPANEARIKKVEHPIMDKLFYHSFTLNTHTYDPLNWAKGDVLSICETDLFANDYNTSTLNSSANLRYAFGFGLYQLTRPGTGQLPLYFALPYTEGMWFNVGPDLGIYYGINNIGSCPINFDEITEDYETQQCAFCTGGSKTFGILGTDIRKYIATTNFTEIYNYWSSPVVTVGFRAQSGSPSGSLTTIGGVNIVEFTATSSPPGCSPTGTPLGTLGLNSSGEYQFYKDFDNNATFNSGTTTLNVHVIANFKDGRSINECKSVSLVSNVPLGTTVTFKNIVVDIRGDIKDYDSGVINYQVSIY